MCDADSLHSFPACHVYRAVYRHYGARLWHFFHLVSDSASWKLNATNSPCSLGVFNFLADSYTIYASSALAGEQ
jgi:hypothetical protein